MCVFCNIVLLTVLYVTHIYMSIIALYFVIYGRIFAKDIYLVYIHMTCEKDTVGIVPKLFLCTGCQMLCDEHYQSERRVQRTIIR